jgi:hypothetical protein
MSSLTNGMEETNKSFLLLPLHTDYAHLLVHVVHSQKLRKNALLTSSHRTKVIVDHSSSLTLQNEQSHHHHSNINPNKTTCQHEAAVFQLVRMRN